jgi:hypothetical protein
MPPVVKDRFHPLLLTIHTARKYKEEIRARIDDILHEIRTMLANRDVSHWSMIAD